MKKYDKGCSPTNLQNNSFKHIYIVVHCAATPPSADIGVAEIRRWHVEDRGWSDIGYHYVIRRNGTIEPGRPHDVVGSHVRGHNRDSVGICLVGGVNAAGAPDANYTDAQWASLKAIVHAMTVEYPHAEVLGHHDFPGVEKACPCFVVRDWWEPLRQEIEAL